MALQHTRSQATAEPLSVIKINIEYAFAILHHRELPSGAFLGKMVVGHENSKVMKAPLRANNENICGNRGYSWKERV